MAKLKKYYKYIFITIVLIILLIGGVVVKADSSSASNQIVSNINYNDKITVEILGEVKVVIPKFKERNNNNETKNGVNKIRIKTNE